MLCRDVRDHPVDLGFLAHIAMKVVRHVAERRGHRGARRVVDIGEDYARTLGEKAFGASTADASRGARYSGGSVLESHSSMLCLQMAISPATSRRAPDR